MTVAATDGTGIHIATQPALNTMSEMHMRPSIVLFGDSITQFGFGEGAVRYGWASLLSSSYQRRADVLNYGFSGYNTRHALELVSRVFGTTENNHCKPSKVLFMTVFFGANDASIPGERQHVPLEEYGDNLSKIVTAIRRETSSLPPFPIIIITPPPIDEEAWKEYLSLFGHYDRKNEMTRNYGLEAKRVAKELNCAVLDTWELLGGDKPGYGKHLCDGLHLNESGNELVHEGLMNLLKQEFPDLSPQEFKDGKYVGKGIPVEEKLWDELC